MTRSLLSLTFMLIASLFVETVNGQSPQQFNYQGVARDNAGNTLAGHLCVLCAEECEVIAVPPLKGGAEERPVLSLPK